MLVSEFYTTIQAEMDDVDKDRFTDDIIEPIALKVANELLTTLGLEGGITENDMWSLIITQHVTDINVTSFLCVAPLLSATTFKILDVLSVYSATVKYIPEQFDIKEYYAMASYGYHPDNPKIKWAMEYPLNIRAVHCSATDTLTFVVKYIKRFLAIPAVGVDLTLTFSMRFQALLISGVVKELTILLDNERG